MKLTSFTAAMQDIYAFLNGLAPFYARIKGIFFPQK